MPAAPLTVTALLSLSTILGVFHLAFGDVVEPSSALVAGGGMVVMTIVASAGMLLARGRWAAPTGAAIALTWIGVALANPLDALALAALAAAAAALAAALGPWLRRWLRHFPRADGPPPAAVVILLTLLATPVVAAFAAPGGIPVAGVALSIWSVALAVAVARAALGSLSAIRVLHPALALVAAIGAGLPGGLAIGAVGAATAALAWRRDVRIALAPAAPQRSSAVAIPPELVPPDILEAAGLDDTGRPR
ncbi:MAG: hypothetical protein A2Z12_08320 [Actinobacteria bacterium RBG_16_68_21]|nr:MAG: hypothetical protein A2Z12_08320 [Actinobacteria bacterium RBG_16_68_21]